MRIDTYLWQRDMPDWDEQELYNLFLRHRGSSHDPDDYVTTLQTIRPPDPVVTAHERNRYALRLMGLVSIKFKDEGWIEKLPHARLEPRDVASELVTHLDRKTQAFKFDNFKKSHKSADNYRIVLAQMYRAMYLRVATLVDEKKNKAHEVPLSDCLRRNDDRRGDGAKPIEAVAVASAPVILLGPFLRSAEDRVCTPVHGKDRRGRNNAESILLLYRWQCRRVVLGSWLDAYCDLPDRLRRRIEPWQHMDITTGIRSLVERAMENLALN